jgi:hypothetical protein
MRLSLGCAVCLGAVIWLARPSHAEGAPRSSCASNQEVERRVAELVGPDAPRGGRADVRVEETLDGHYRVQVLVQTPRGNAVRQFEAATCELATNIAALIVAISLHPDRSAELEERAQSKPPPPIQVEERAAPTVQLLAPVPREQGAPPARARSFSLAAELFSDWTSMPSLSLGGGGTLGFRPNAQLFFEASLGAFAAQTIELPNGRSARFDMASAAVRACVVAKPGSVFAACLGAVGVRLQGNGSGSELPHDSTAWYVGPSAGILARVPVSRGWALRASMHVFGPIGVHRFLLDGAEVHRPFVVGIAGQVGPEVSF